MIIATALIQHSFDNILMTVLILYKISQFIKHKSPNAMLGLFIWLGDGFIKSVTKHQLCLVPPAILARSPHRLCLMRQCAVSVRGAESPAC